MAQPPHGKEVTLAGYVGTYCMDFSCFTTRVIFFSLKTVVAMEMWSPGWLSENMLRFLTTGSLGKTKKKSFFVVLARFYDVNILITEPI